MTPGLERLGDNCISRPPKRGLQAETCATKRVGLALLEGCLGLFLLDCLVFRTPWYAGMLEPGSAAGRFELVLSREKAAQARYGNNLIVALGDSRLGITPKLCNDLEPETSYFFRSAGVAGTDPRAWYHMLRDLDPSARRYRAILMTVNSYDDEEDFSHPDDDIRALTLQLRAWV
jgi:hypothetical protein